VVLGEMLVKFRLDVREGGGIAVAPRRYWLSLSHQPLLSDGDATASVHYDTAAFQDV